ncbi:MAG: Hsp70 family protein [Brevirhabdus sp.]
MARNGHALGIDFGTSNTAAGFMAGGQPRLIALEGARDTLPTTFFFDYDTRHTLMGQAANQALLDGAEGRFMRALKRVLGTPLMHEPRQLLNERLTFVDVISRFLRRIKQRAEAETGLTFDRVLSGRPVVFHGAGDPREAQAEADLRTCYMAAGFEQVAFMAEPEAAAIASGALAHPGELGLIVDIGGGTSDFSVFRVGAGGVDILANHGVRIGGTDFDRAISIEQVMPVLGKGTALRKVMGPGLTPVPAALFNSLATWEEIPFLYTAQNRRRVSEMHRLAEAPEKLGRLAEVLDNELGHDVAFAVEAGKIAVNSDAAAPGIELGVIEPGLRVALSSDALERCLDPFAQALSEGIAETLARAGVDAAQVDRVVYVGGSSLMRMIGTVADRAFPNAEHAFANVFTAVAQGLARAAPDRLAG